MPPEKKGKDAPSKGGRPRTNPPGSRQQSYRGTDEEHAKLMEYLKFLRSQSK